PTPRTPGPCDPPQPLCTALWRHGRSRCRRAPSPRARPKGGDRGAPARPPRSRCDGTPARRTGPPPRGLRLELSMAPCQPCSCLSGVIARGFEVLLVRLDGAPTVTLVGAKQRRLHEIGLAESRARKVALAVPAQARHGLVGAFTL